MGDKNHKISNTELIVFLKKERENILQYVKSSQGPISNDEFFGHLTAYVQLSNIQSKKAKHILEDIILKSRTKTDEKAYYVEGYHSEPSSVIDKKDLKKIIEKVFDKQFKVLVKELKAEHSALYTHDSILSDQENDYEK